MPVCKNDKARILRSYLEKSISKDQMEILLNEGTNIPPIPWIFSSEEDQKKDSEKREIMSRVLGITFQKVEWV